MISNKPKWNIVIFSMNNKYLAIIPARGGSKRLPRKNVLNLCGKPLIVWSIEAGLKSKYIDKVLVSSDDEEILKVAKTYNADIIQRPEQLSSDTSTTFDAIKHAIDNYEQYEYIVLLQPTSPLRTSQHIDEAIKLLEEKNADAVVSICEVEHSPLWCNTIDESMDMSNFLSDSIKNVRSQDLPTYYRINGAIYIIKTKILLKEKTFFPSKNIFAYKMSKLDSIDIDDKIDFLIAQTILLNQ